MHLFQGQGSDIESLLEYLSCLYNQGQWRRIVHQIFLKPLHD